MELSRSPVIALDKYLNKKIQICLKDNFKLKGVLQNFDKFNNMLLKEVIRQDEDKIEQLGEVYVNGHNLITIIELEI